MAFLVIFEYYYSPLLLCRFLYLLQFSFVFLSQAVVTPLSEHLLGWREIENSILYCLIALEVSTVLIICLYFIVIDHGLGE